MDITFSELLGYLLNSGGASKFYANVLGSLAYEESKSVPMMGVKLSGRGITLTCNPDWFKNTTYADAVATIEHEALHVILEHIPRGIRRHLLYKGSPDEGVFTRTHNIAVDMSVNSLLRDGNKELAENPKEWVFPEQDPWKYETHLIYEEYSQKLMEWAKQKQDEFKKKIEEMVANGQLGSNEGEGGGEGRGEDEGKGEGEGKSGGKGKNIEHSWLQDAAGLTTEEQFAISQEIHEQTIELVKTAIADTTSGDPSKLRGLLPAGVMEIVEKLVAPPIVPYLQVLRSMVVNTRKFKVRRSIRRPHRRHVGVPGLSLFPGRTKDMKYTIGFIVDTSGSMGTKELQEAVVELQGLQRVDKDVEIYVIESDAGVQDCYTLHANDKLEPEFRGRGGTTFDPALLHAKTQPLDIVFYYTDGYAPAPNKESRVSVPFVWLITKNGVIPDPDWGRVIQLSDYGARR